MDDRPLRLRFVTRPSIAAFGTFQRGGPHMKHFRAAALLAVTSLAFIPGCCCSFGNGEILQRMGLGSRPSSCCECEPCAAGGCSPWIGGGCAPCTGGCS